MTSGDQPCLCDSLVGDSGAVLSFVMTLLQSAGRAIAYIVHRAVQKCGQSAFCTRLRGAQGKTCSVDSKSVSVQDSAMTASIACGDSKSLLDLTLTAYQGVARFHINEATDAGKQRFQVPHVLLPSLDGLKTSWQDSASASSSIKLSLGEADLTLQYNPLQLDVSVNGIPVMSFNSKQLFNFEQLRTKQVKFPESCLEKQCG